MGAYGPSNYEVSALSTSFAGRVSTGEMSLLRETSTAEDAVALFHFVGAGGGQFGFLTPEVGVFDRSFRFGGKLGFRVDLHATGDERPSSFWTVARTVILRHWSPVMWPERFSFCIWLRGGFLRKMNLATP